MAAYSETQLELTILLMRMRRNVPVVIPSGPLRRLPRRRNSGASVTFRIVIPVIVTSSREPPSTHSSASPRQVSKTQFETAMFLNPPLEDVPNLILPVGFPFAPPGVNFLKVPSKRVPRS